MKKQRETVKKDTVRGRKKSFLAILAAVLMVFNLLPMNAFATDYAIDTDGLWTDHQYYNPNHTGLILSSGDKITNMAGGEHLYFDVVPGADNQTDTRKVEVTPGSNNYYFLVGEGEKYSAKKLSGGIVFTSIYTVTFDSDGGTAVASQEIIRGGNVDLPTAPTKEGFAFDKWVVRTVATAETPSVEIPWNFGTATTPGDAVTANTTLYAKWTANAYTVAFDANGGSGTMSNQARTYGDGASLTANAFTRTGHTFSGWNTLANGNGTAYANSASGNLSSIDGDTVTLYAQWTVNNYTVTFNSNGGSTVAAQSKAYGSKADKPANPIKIGYTFDGWYKEATYSNAWNFGTATTPGDTVTGDTTLYAKWTANAYTVQFDANGEGVTGTMNNQARTYDDNASLTANAFTRTGYTFSGWNTSANGNETAYANSATGNLASNAGDIVTLYAQWTKNNYTVTFNSNGGSGTMNDQNRTYDDGASLTANTFTRTGHSFSGWNTLANGYGTAYANSAPGNLSSIDGDTVTLYAQWTVNNYTVTFDSDGGSAVAAQSKAYGSKADKPADPIKIGYTFDGWYKEAACSNAWNFGTATTGDTVTGDTTLYAKWTANAYTVRFDSNEGTGGTMNDQVRTYNDGASLTANTFTRTGYTFSGWNKAADGSATAYANSATGNLSSTAGAIVTLYAQWTANNYTVTFDSNGGSAVAAQALAYGSKAVKPADSTKEGYSFDKWVTRTAGTSAANTVETEWDFDTNTVTADVTLYAKWNEIPSYTVSFDTDGGSAVASQSIKTGSKAVKPADPTKEGYSFDKWVTRTAGTSAANTVETEWDFDTNTVTADVTLYAKWTKNATEDNTVVKYKVTFNSDGGSAVADQTVNAGDKAVKPTDPTKEGYTFDKWVTKTAGTDASNTVETEWKFDTNTVTADVTLYAKWTQNKTEDNTETETNTVVTYKVTFDSNGGSEVTAQTVNAGDKASKPADPTKSGYKFSGWYITAADQTESLYDFDSAVNSDITLKAKYTFNKESLGDSDSKFDISEGYTDFTDDMKEAGFDTEEKVKTAMYTAVVEELDDDEDIDEAELIVGSQLYDVDFLVSFDGGKTWEKVTEETFPEDGLTVEMDYPEGTDAKTNNFVVAHMFTHNMLGHKAGETETMVPEKTDTGIKFKVSSLSPVLVTWSLAAQGVTVTPKNVELTYAGQTAQLTATVTPVGALDKSVIWSSSNTSVATVDTTGKVTAVAEGSCFITVTTVDGGFTDTANITVKYPVKNTQTNDVSAETANATVDTSQSRAPKTGGNVTALFVMAVCLAAGAGLTGYAFYRRKRR